MNRTYYTVIGLIILFSAGCQKGPYPWITKKDVQKIDSAVHPAIKNVAFIYNKDVYYVADMDKPATRITTDGSAIGFVKMSHDHSKFAYLNPANRIQIVDNKGVIITTLSQYTQVKSFDWSADDQTLYILNGNAMAYYGPSLNLPAISYPGIINGSTKEVLSASVSMKGDFAFVVHGYNFFYGDKYELVIQPANNGAQIVYGVPANHSGLMGYVSFSSNNQDMIVGYTETEHIGPASQEYIDYFTDLKSYPDLSTSVNTDWGYTPLYNSTLNYIVTAFADPDDEKSNLIMPAAFYLGPRSDYADANIPHSKFLRSYGVSIGSLYTDWK